MVNQVSTQIDSRNVKKRARQGASISRSSGQVQLISVYYWSECYLVKLNSGIMIADIKDDGLFGHYLLSQSGAEILYTEGDIRFRHFHTL